MRRGPKPAKSKVEAKPPVARKSLKDDRARVRDLENQLAEALRDKAEALKLQAEALGRDRELTEAREQLMAAHAQVSESHEQQTATSEILRVISQSPTDVQPVFDTIVKHSVRLCDAVQSNVQLFDGERMHWVAEENINPEAMDSIRGLYPMRPDRSQAASRAVLARSVVHLPDVLNDSEYHREMALKGGWRSVLSVPMLKEGNPIGVITVARRELFSEMQIVLLQTFADQAVIAIENVRLFNETKEALEQQTATAEILRVISTSPTDLQPVLDAVVTSAARFCGADDAELYRLDGGSLTVVAHHGPIPAPMGRLVPVVRGTVAGRAVLERQAVHVADLHTEAEGFPVGNALAREFGFRTALAVPLLREGTALGTINLRRTVVNPFSNKQVALLKTFADQAVIAIENVRLFTELEARNRDLTATSEILQVISRSPTDAQPVFDTIVESSVRLCGGLFGIVHRFDGEVIDLAAHHKLTPEGLRAYRAVYPMPVSRETVAGRAILDRAVVHVIDSQDPEQAPWRSRAMAQATGFRSVLAVPMLREGHPIGVINVARREAAPFSEGHITLLKTFAEQAVIAIENVRLFKELQASNRDLTTALEQQTATAEILRVISQSQTNVQPVFDTIVRSAVKLCDGLGSVLYQFDGELIQQIAQHNYTPEALETAHRIFPARPTRALGSGRAILERAVVHIPDVEVEPEYQHQALSRVVGYRSGVWVPMLREGAPIGVIVVTRAEPGPFSDDQIALLKTFADQAVIAVENVRLFKELQERNRDLTESLEQQTATSEILRVISSSPTDVQPVFDAIAEQAMRLCEAVVSNVCRFDGELVHLAATTNVDPDGVMAIRGAFPMRLGPQSAATRAVLKRTLVHIPDILDDPEYGITQQSLASGFRSALAVPMLREGSPLGSIIVGRPQPGPFSARQIALLETFADQAVIAIENVRLFTELQASNRELTTALDTQTATSDILRVISHAQTDVQPVFDAILVSAVRLLQGYSGVVTRVAGDQLDLAALTRTTDAGDAAVRALYPERLDSQATHVRAARNRAPLNIADAHSDPRLPEVEHTRARVRGYRSHVVVPLLRQDEAIGTIGVTRREPGGFNDDEIALLQIFADQAVIAIENVRLFTELQEKNRALTEAHAQVTETLEQQTATSEILEVMSQSQTDAQPVFEAIVKSALRLCDGFFSIVYRFDGEMMSVAADHQVNPRASAALRALYPAPARRDHIVGRALLDRRQHHIADVATDPELGGNRNVFMSAFPYRTALAVPMLLRGVPIGAIAIGRSDVRPFTDKQIEVLETFADQAVIAIENVRLFKELEARTGELTKSVEKLTALSEVSRAVSSTLDVETVLDTIVSRANQLAGADACGIYEYNENAQMFQVRATHNFDSAFVARLRAMPLHKGEGAAGKATEAHEPIQIADIAVPGAYESRVRDLLIGAGFRALLSVPLVREEQIIGSLSLLRKMPGEYSPEVVEVLKTFATQSALAIQNARLFREIADKSAQLEAASRHKSEFLANMSHELRTPLNAIIGFSEVLTERMFGELNEKQDEYLKDIFASGQHLLSLINDILDLSKIEAGRMELELSDFHLPTALDNALTLVRERAGRRSITLQTSVDERLGEVRADERKVRQVVLNLLSNAIKFTPEGGSIEVRAVPKDGFVEVSVTDTGVGIAPEDQEAVFEEFRQVGTAEKKVEGTGLGLTLCRKFVELHGGKIWVTSQVGVGSTFTFSLPLRNS